MGHSAAQEQSFNDLALFPLMVHVLPGGRTRLRIFEPRYVRLVKEAMKGNRRFGLCMLNPDGDSERNQHIFPIGTEVEIIDFERLEDGLLGITIEGKRLLVLSDIITSNDDLRHGNGYFPDDMQDDFELPDSDILRLRLQEVFDVYPEIAENYPDQNPASAQWICFRWLELLPLQVSNKQELVSKPLLQLYQYISELFQAEPEETSERIDPLESTSRTS